VSLAKYIRIVERVNIDDPGSYKVPEQAAQQANTPPPYVNYGIGYLEKAASGAPGIKLISADDAKAALDWLSKNPNYIRPAAEPDHLAEPPMRAPKDPNAPNAFANKTRRPKPAGNLGDGFDTVDHNGQKGVRDTHTGKLILISNKVPDTFNITVIQDGQEKTYYGLRWEELGPATQRALQKIGAGGVQETYESSEQVRRIVDRMMEDARVPQKPRQGPLRPQTGAGKHRDKKKDQKQGKEKHKKPIYEQDYTPDEIVDILSGKKTQAQVDAEKKSKTQTTPQTPKPTTLPPTKTTKESAGKIKSQKKLAKKVTERVSPQPDGTMSPSFAQQGGNVIPKASVVLGGKEYAVVLQGDLRARYSPGPGVPRVSATGYIEDDVITLTIDRPTMGEGSGPSFAQQGGNVIPKASVVLGGKEYAVVLQGDLRARYSPGPGVPRVSATGYIEDDVITLTIDRPTMGEGSGAKYKVKSIGKDNKGEYHISPSTGKKVYKSGANKGDHENPKTGEIKKSVAEARYQKVSAQQKFKNSMKRAGYDMDACAKRLQDLLDKQKKEREEKEKKDIAEGLGDSRAKLLYESIQRDLKLPDSYYLQLSSGAKSNLKNLYINYILESVSGVKKDTLETVSYPELKNIVRMIEEKQKGVDGKACWKGYKRMGTKKKGRRTVDNCVKMEQQTMSGTLSGVTGDQIVNHPNYKKYYQQYLRNPNSATSHQIAQTMAMANVKRDIMAAQQKGLQEKSPPGFKGTVKAMKKHPELTKGKTKDGKEKNPWALAWHMKNKGYKSHKKADGSDKD